MKNLELVKKLQFGHGEWTEDMILVCKLISHVVEVLPFIKSPHQHGVSNYCSCFARCSFGQPFYQTQQRFENAVLANKHFVKIYDGS